MRLRCLAANGLWLLSSAPDALLFRSQLDRIAEVQEDILLRTLRRNAATPFGIAHGFASIRSIRDYRERVPIRTYDERDLPSGIAESIERFEKTSGSSGASKRIPYTRTLRRQFHAAIAPWIASLFVAEPRAFAGEAYWSVSPGAESDEEVLGFLQRRLVRAVQAVPSSVRLASDVDAWRRETLAALTACRSLSLISVWHPSFLELLIGNIDTVATWPQLRVVSCWADANARDAAASLARRFPHAKIQPKGLLSTEGFVTIPFDGAHALAYRSHFFEFVDESRNALLAHELEVGRRYGVILTTGGGLYRYDTEDIVEVTGFIESCPTLRFIGRAHHVSDHFGEKLHEIFVRERLEIALRDVPRSLALLACDGDAYVLFIESAAPDETLVHATASLESALRESHHYDYCRRLGQLAPLRTFRIAGNGASTYLTSRAAWQILGDIKIPALERETGWSERFQGQFLEPRSDAAPRTPRSPRTSTD